MNLAVETQVLLRISLSVGRSLDLDTMLGEALSSMVRMTNSLGAVVIQRDQDGPEHHWLVARAVPMRMGRDRLFSGFLVAHPPRVLWQRLEARDGHGMEVFSRGEHTFHVFKLPGYGLLILLAAGEPFSRSFCESFGAVADKLAQSCLACRQNQELERWGHFERLLTHFSLRFMNARESELDPLINEGLERIGRLVRADRAFLFTYDLEAYTATNTHEWCAEGVSSEIANLQQTPLHGLEAWVNAHRAGEVYNVPDVHALSEDDPLRHVLGPQGIKSNITIPIMGGEHCEGFVGFDAVRAHRAWGSLDVAILRTMADMFANAEIRRRQQREIRRAQRALIHSRDKANELAMEAKAASEAKSRFLATVSHEIRTPITAMMGLAEMLLDSPLDSRQQRHARSLLKSGEALRRIINDILDFSEIEAGRVRIHPEPVELARLIRESLQLLEPSARARGNRLSVMLTDDLPKGVMVDPVRVRQMLWNLVGNAIKFTELGRIAVSVCQDLDAAPPSVSGRHCLRFEVTDTGIGIDRSVRERLFEPFFQASQKGMTRVGGTGLGLPIVKNLVRAMGGDMGVESKKDVGTRVWFRLSLPPANVDEADATGRFKALPPQTLTRKTPGTPSAEGEGDGGASRVPKVLVVEDDEDVRELLAETLERLGCQVELLSNGAEAVAYGKERGLGHVDLVLMDCQMPVMDGIRATREIRRGEGRSRQVPIIALTAALTKDQREAYLEAGMDDWLPKPYTRKELSSMLNKWLNEGAVRGT
ncbi:ATP-binding protein [Ectothiorhodospira variabilis]|uniref:GAF domain-containing hybrid sensor histidine kinase/response regulator n=1 Tax=Ectothiorhodospira variabilis TaxID=505694 RepID=UPI001EFA8F73|nr:ATP-binding protein [Ectothiorhodospira variabilis]MCG5505273.1 ATP-binding protein [Ectothiorhodospira variabilis]MCG5508430.1 ATP-binding protein [Ectothiorhodospira variabilis]